MKKLVTCSFVFVLNVLLFSFTPAPGGDVFELYLNGQKVHQQFIHVDKGIKHITLRPFTGNDKLEVLYSHCGQAGKGRILTIKNEKNEMVKELKFGDGKDQRSLMALYKNDMTANKAAKVKLFYSSKEFPEAQLLAIITWSTSTATAAL